MEKPIDASLFADKPFSVDDVRDRISRRMTVAEVQRVVENAPIRVLEFDDWLDLWGTDLC